MTTHDPTLLEKLLSELEALEAPPEIDLMLRDHPGKRITAGHVARARSAAERWLLIAWRFPWLYKSRDEPAKAPESLQDIQKLQKTVLTPTPLPEGEGTGVRVPSPLQLDLEKIRPHLKDIIQAGQFVRGYQTRIAEILGITNAGATHRQRILKVVQVLKSRLINSSTSSTATEAPAELDSGEQRAA